MVHSEDVQEGSLEQQMTTAQMNVNAFIAPRGMHIDTEVCSVFIKPCRGSSHRSIGPIAFDERFARRHYGTVYIQYSKSVKDRERDYIIGYM